MTKQHTKKADNLCRNNKLVLVVHKATTQTVLQLKGFAEEIVDYKQANEVFRAMLGASRMSGSAIPPLSKLRLGEYIAYRVMPKQIRMAVFVDAKTGGYETYKTIDF